jgi:hypothetical protein
MKFGVTMFPNSLEDVASGAWLSEEMGFGYVGIAASETPDGCCDKACAVFDSGVDELFPLSYRSGLVR